jgi:hypothetical protein
MRPIARSALLAAALLLALAPAALAAPVPVSSDDVALTPASGYGGWSHAYTNPATPSGRFLGATNCTAPPCPLVDERGGSGTLNDGVVATSISDTQLLVAGTDSAGTAFSPTITVHFASPVAVHQIRLSGGDIDFNLIPGLLNGVSVTIAGQTVALSTTPAGGVGALGTQFDDVVDLTGTGLDATATDTVTLGDFTADPIGLGQFSVTEVSVDGTPAPPTTDTLCSAIRTAVTGSAAYRALPPKRRADVDRLIDNACAAARAILDGPNRARFIDAFVATVDRLAAAGWLTPAQASSIEAIARTL